MSRRRNEAWILPLALLTLIQVRSAFAGSTGTTNLITQQGSGAPRPSGDFVSNTGSTPAGINTFYSYFIEVPAGLGRIEVDLFDADIGMGGAAEAPAGRDRERNGFNTAALYTLIDPSGVTRATLFADVNGPAASDNAWIDFFDSRVPTFRSLATATTTGNTTLTIATPAGTVQNDLLILILSKNDNGAINTPAGWTLVSEGACAGGGGGACRLGVFRLVQGAVVPANYTVTWANNVEAVGAILNYTGVNTGTPIDVFGAATGDSTTPTAPSVTTTVANTRIVRIYGADDDLSGTPYPASHTGRFNLDANNTIVAGAADATRFTAGGTGTAAFALAASDQWRAVTLALRPVATAPAPQNGHWELRADMSSAVTGGDAINAFGIRAHDGTSGAGGTELNVYQHSYAAFGVNEDFGSRTYSEFSYISSGCVFDNNSFDWDENSDENGSVVHTSRTAAFSQSVGTLSGNNAWDNDVVSGWTNDQNSIDYGIWPMSVTISDYPNNGNYGQIYLGNSAAADANPTAQPEANTFRMYLPNDGGAAPAKAYVEQQIRYGGSGGNNGPNPPVAGTQSIFTVTVRVVNPEAQAITFSATNLVTANVPGAGVLYGGLPQVSQGAIVAQPALGGTGNITWNPGTLAAGATGLLSYLVRVTPTSAGQRLPATATPASGNGTRAQYVDNTGNTTQARATYLFGPLCELAVTQGLLTPVVVTGLRTIKTADGVTVEWHTASEVGAAGFDLYRWDMGRSRWVKVNQRLIPALVGAPQGGRYRVLDPGGSKTGRQWYLLKETETSGPGKTYGPFDTSAGEDDGRRLANDNDERRARKPGRALLDASAASNARAALRKAAAPAPKLTAALKIGVNETGLVFVSKETIAAHFGLSAANAASMLASGRFNLTNQGSLVAWLAASDERGLLFFGEAVDSVYTRDNVYWLRRGHGSVIDQVRTGPAPARGATAAFRDTTHAEEDLLPATVVATDPNSDYWFWDYLSAGDPVQGKKSFAVNATSLSPGGNPLLRVNLSGATATGVENEHHVVVRLNGVSVGEDHWTGITARTLSLPVNAFLLREGANDVEVEALLDSGVGFSIFYVDSFDLTYRRAFAAIGSALALRGDGVPGVTVTDFADPDVVVLDVSSPKLPRRVKRVRVQGTGGSYRASFAPATPATNYFAVSETGWRAPAWTEADVPSDLKDRNAGADYVIVTTSELAASAEALATLRSNAGLSTLVVDIQDIYDEFSFGLQDPRAMQSFLSAAARRWSTPPRYVLIAGRGNLDYRNNLGFGGNLVPPLMVSTPKGLFASDTHLGDVRGSDSIPEIAVGRIPVLSGDELEAYADKVEAYEQAQAPESARQLLLLADTPDAGTDFGAASDQIAGSPPDGYDASRIYLQPGVDVAGPREELFGALTGGVDLVNYTGHGALDRLSAQGLLTSVDARALSNQQLPVLTALSCTINRFEVQGFAPLGEELVKRRGAGFAAVWAPTGLSVHAEATLLGKAFYSGLAAHPGARLGDAVNRAFQSYQALGGLAWMPDIYSLLGDPALTLKEGVVVEPADDGGPPTPSTE